jgi:hypothetical protein
MLELTELGFDRALTELGFDPAHDVAGVTGTTAAVSSGPPGEPGGTQREAQTATISFTRCPFREVAALYPDLVCQLHRGITDGLLRGLAAGYEGGEARLESFSTLLDEDPCRAEVSISA